MGWKNTAFLAGIHMYVQLILTQPSVSQRLNSQWTISKHRNLYPVFVQCQCRKQCAVYAASWKVRFMVRVVDGCVACLDFMSSPCPVTDLQLLSAFILPKPRSLCFNFLTLTRFPIYNYLLLNVFQGLAELAKWKQSCLYL